MLLVIGKHPTPLGKNKRYIMCHTVINVEENSNEFIKTEGNCSLAYDVFTLDVTLYLTIRKKL